MYPCGKLSAAILIDRKAVSPHPSPYRYHLLSSFRLLTADRFSVLSHNPSVSDMSQPSSSSSLRDLFDTALQDYEIQTGTSLVDHPFAKQLEACDSVDSITAVLQEQAQIFRKFRGDDGKIMKSLKCSIDVLYTLSVSTESISLVRPKSFIGVIYS